MRKNLAHSKPSEVPIGTLRIAIQVAYEKLFPPVFSNLLPSWMGIMGGIPGVIVKYHYFPRLRRRPEE